MAFKMNYIAKSKTVYTDSYWRLTKLDIDRERKIAEFSLSPYKDEETATLAKTDNTVAKIDFDRKYFISGSDFDKYFSSSSIQTLQVSDFYASAFKAAKDSKDNPSGSFFKTAEDV